MRAALPATLSTLAVLVALVAALVADSALPGAESPASTLALTTPPEPAERDRPAPPGHGRAGIRRLPSAAGLRAASEYAASRAGVVSFAVVNSDGEARGRAQGRRFAAASVVKAMLLAAETLRLRGSRAPVDDSTDALLSAMITASDNGAADSIYSRVGDAGLAEVAERAGMTRFTVAGHWGNAQIAAGDVAAFFADLDGQFPRRYREYAKGLLGSVTESQLWGIPSVAGEAWAVRLKGGWLPDRALVHQAAELRERDGSRELAVAVLTDDQPSFAYGIETVEGVAARLLSRDGRPGG